MRNLVVALLFIISMPAFAAQLEINWDKFSEGQMPTNFHSALAGGGRPGNWQIVMDIVPSTFAPLTDKAPVSRRAVLAQTSTDATDERYPMFVYDGEEFKDFKLTSCIRRARRAARVAPHEACDSERRHAAAIVRGPASS